MYWYLFMFIGSLKLNVNSVWWLIFLIVLFTRTVHFANVLFVFVHFYFYTRCVNFAYCSLYSCIHFTLQYILRIAYTLLRRGLLHYTLLLDVYCSTPVEPVYPTTKCTNIWFLIYIAPNALNAFYAKLKIYSTYLTYFVRTQEP